MVDDAATNLRSNIQELLDRYKLSQAEFARLAGVSQSNLNRFLLTTGDESSPTLVTVQAIANGFGVDMCQLLRSEAIQNNRPSPRILSRQMSRLIEDFLSCNEDARLKILSLAEHEANSQAH